MATRNFADVIRNKLAADPELAKAVYEEAGRIAALQQVRDLLEEVQQRAVANCDYEKARAFRVAMDAVEELF